MTAELSVWSPVASAAGMHMSQPERYYALITYEKSGPLRYLAHLDIARAFDRAVRRAQIPVKYSEGFTPRAHISFPPPLPVGAEGTAELCAVELVEAADARQIYAALAAELERFRIGQIEVRRGIWRLPWAELQAATYEVVPDFIDEAQTAALARAAAKFMAVEEVILERQTKTRVRSINIRPHVYGLGVTGNTVSMCLGITEETLVKPAELLAALADIMGMTGGGWRRLVRTGLHSEIAPEDACTPTPTP